MVIMMWDMTLWVLFCRGLLNMMNYYLICCCLTLMREGYQMCWRKTMPGGTLKCTRSQTLVAKMCCVHQYVCVFCDLPAEWLNELHSVTTFTLDQRVKECDAVLSDDRLLAKLAVGDMIAVEAKYHSSCLAQLYNRRRSIKREQMYV